MAKETNNKFEIMAESSANIQTDAQYLADAERVAGVVSGVARSILYNTGLRQNSKITVAVANFMARKNPLTEINTALTTEQIDALLESAIKDAAASGPGSQVITATYVSGGRFVANITPYVFNDQNKLTIRYSGVIPDADLDLPVILSVDNGSTDYPVKVKDVGNQFLVRNTITEIADVFRNGSEVIINRTEPAAASESEYDLPIQSQQTIVPVEASPFGDNKIEGESPIQPIINGNGNDGITGWTGLSCSISNPSGNILSTGDGTSNNCRTLYIKNISGELLSKTKVKVTNSDCLSLIILLVTTTGDVTIETISNPTINTWYYPKGLSANVDMTQLRIIHQYVDAATANGKVLEIEETMIIPLLSVKQLAMTVTQLNNKYPLYFDSLKSVENPEIKVRNNNLIPSQILLKGFDVNYPNVPGTGTTPDVYRRTDGEVFVKAGTYVVSVENSDIKIRPISEESNFGFSSTNEYLFTLTYDQYVYFNFRNSGTTTWLFEETTDGIKCHLEIKSSLPASNYIKPDNSSKKYPLQTLRGVTNGTEDVEDYIDTENNDLHELVGNDYNDVVKSSTGWIRSSQSDINVNVSIFYLDLTSTLDYKVPTADTIKAKILMEIAAIILPFGDQTTLFGADVEGVAIASNSRIYVYILKTKLTIDTASGLETYLQANNVEFQYELAAEIITKDIDVDGIAFAYKNMTIELIQDNGFGFSAYARHALNDPETIRSLGKALQTAEKQIIKLEDEAGLNTIHRSSDGKDHSDVVANSLKNSYPSGDATKVGHISVSAAVNLDKVNERTLLWDTGLTIPTATTKPSSNITLSESMANFDKLELEVQVGNFITINVKVSLAASTFAKTVIPLTNLWASGDLNKYMFQLEWDTANTMTAFYSGYIKTVLGVNPEITWSALSVTLIKIYGIK